MLNTFNTKTITTREEIDKVTSMASSSPEQNQYLKQTDFQRELWVIAYL